MVIDPVSFRGEVRAVVFEGDPTPEQALAYLDDGAECSVPVVFDQTWRNLVTNVGRGQMTLAMVGQTTAYVTNMGLTTSVIVPALADTSLATEIYRIPLAIVTAFGTYYQRYVAFFPTAAFGSTGINGEGLFDTATTGGKMWADAVLTVSKTTVQGLVVDHRIFSSS